MLRSGQALACHDEVYSHYAANLDGLTESCGRPSHHTLTVIGRALLHSTRPRRSTTTHFVFPQYDENAHSCQVCYLDNMGTCDSSSVGCKPRHVQSEPPQPRKPRPVPAPQGAPACPRKRRVVASARMSWEKVPKNHPPKRWALGRSQISFRGIYPKWKRTGRLHTWSWATFFSSLYLCARFAHRAQSSSRSWQILLYVYIFVFFLMGEFYCEYLPSAVLAYSFHVYASWKISCDNFLICTWQDNCDYSCSFLFLLPFHIGLITTIHPPLSLALPLCLCAHHQPLYLASPPSPFRSSPSSNFRYRPSSPSLKSTRPPPGPSPPAS